jgi:hypothetical protein
MNSRTGPGIAPSGQIAAWSAAACALLAAALFYGPYLLRMDLFSDDVAHHIFWLYRYADPELFAGDISVTYFMTSAPWGYRTLYAGLAPFVDVLQASKWLSVVLFMASAMLAWNIGTQMAQVERQRELFGLLAIVALSLLLVLSRQRDLLAPIGFQRAFALPLLLWTLWALVSRRYAWVGASWLAAALFYPVVLPVQGLTAAAVFLRDIYIERRMPARWMMNGLLGATALTIAKFGMPIPSEIGPAYSYREAIRMPEFQLGGRLSMYGEGVFDWTRHHRTGLGWDREVMLLMGIGVVLAWYFNRLRSIPFAAWAMVVVGVGLWAAMRLLPEQLMFGLYLPNRHSRWALGVFGMVAIAAGAGVVLEELWRRFWRDSPRRDAVFRWVVPLAAPVIIVAALFPNTLRLLETPVDVDLERTYEFIATLPKDTLVAAHPELADFVPIRSRRSVLTSTEISMAWMHNYYREMKPRVEASLRAAYATRIEDVDAALEPYGVDVFVASPYAWRNTTYFKPFDKLVDKLVEDGARTGFVLSDPPAERVLFRSGEYFVVRVGKCEGDEC